MKDHNEAKKWSKAYHEALKHSLKAGTIPSEPCERCYDLLRRAHEAERERDLVDREYKMSNGYVIKKRNEQIQQANFTSKIVAFSLGSLFTSVWLLICFYWATFGPIF